MVPTDKLPPVIVPVAETVPPVVKLPTVAVPVAETVPPVVKLPPVIVPATLKLANVPTLVIFGCTAVVNTPAK